MQTVTGVARGISDGCGPPAAAPLALARTFVVYLYYAWPPLVIRIVFIGVRLRRK